MNVTESRDISPDNDKNSMLNILSAKTEILTALHDVPPLVRSLDVVKRKMPRCKGLPDEPCPLKRMMFDVMHRRYRQGRSDAMSFV